MTTYTHRAAELTAYTTAVIRSRAAYTTETSCVCGVRLPFIADSHVITRRCPDCRLARRAERDAHRYRVKKEEA